MPKRSRRCCHFFENITTTSFTHIAQGVLFARWFSVVDSFVFLRGWIFIPFCDLCHYSHLINHSKRTLTYTALIFGIGEGKQLTTGIMSFSVPFSFFHISWDIYQRQSQHHMRSSWRKKYSNEHDIGDSFREMITKYHTTSSSTRKRRGGAWQQRWERQAGFD